MALRPRRALWQVVLNTKSAARPGNLINGSQSLQSLISLLELLQSMSKAASKAGKGAVWEREDEEMEKPAEL